jgi:crotonobetainyl-CoA:carnitine CoA-transferase CaiB-like acyl-CoA transferase
VQNRPFLNEFLTNEIKKWTCDELLENLNRNLVPAGQIRDLKDVFDQPEVKKISLASNGFRGVRTLVTNPLPELPTHFPPPPRLGEHTKQVMQLLNFGPTAIQGLFENHIIG